MNILIFCRIGSINRSKCKKSIILVKENNVVEKKIICVEIVKNTKKFLLKAF